MTAFFATVTKTSVDHNDYIKVTFVIQNKEYDFYINNKEIMKYPIRSIHRISFEPVS